jgi:alpha-beta hydrolase superfamily lysophospholipase
MKRPTARWQDVLLATVIALVLCLALVVLLAAAVGRAPAPWVPEPVQNLAFDARLAVGPPAKKLVTAMGMPLHDSRVYLDRHRGQRDAEAMGSVVPGTLYHPEMAGPGPYPGILLLHGSTPEGWKMGLYRLLGRALADRGYVVLSIDHGSTGDAAAGLEFLGSLGAVGNGGLTIMGHSGGAAVALSAGIPHHAVSRIVAIGPGVRVEDRAEAESAYFERRRLRYGKPARVSWSAAVPARQTLEFHMNYFARSDHKPLLLVQGEREDRDDRKFLRGLYATMAGPATLLIIPDADHYMNVINVGPLVAYDPGAAERLVAGIDGWLTDGAAAAGCEETGSTCGWWGFSLLPLLALTVVVIVALGAALLGSLRSRRRRWVGRQSIEA